MRHAEQLAGAEGGEHIAAEAVSQMGVEVGLAQIALLVEAGGVAGGCAPWAAGVVRVEEALYQLRVGLGQRQGRAPGAGRDVLVVGAGELKAIGVDLAIGRILVEVDWRLRIEHRALQRAWTGGFLVLHHGVEIQSRLAAGQIAARAQQHMAPVQAGVWIGIALARAVGCNRGIEAALRQYGRGAALVGTETAVGEVCPPGGLAGAVVDQVDGAGEGGGAVKHRRRSALHLDALDIAEIQCGELRNERTAGRHAVHQQQKVVHLAQAEQARHRAGRAIVAAGRHRHAAQQGQGRAQITDAARPHVFGGDHFDRIRHFLHRFGKAVGGDLHQVQPGYSGPGDRLRMRRSGKGQGGGGYSEAMPVHDPEASLFTDGPVRWPPTAAAAAPGPARYLRNY